MIRSLSNGLEILIYLNRRDSASAGELSSQLSIPRATVYRILSTLCDKGFVYQHPDDQRFHMTPKVRVLSDGYTDEDQLASISRPYLLNLTKILRWPVALACIEGVELVLRDNTDKASPLAIEHFSSGYRVPLLGSASGPCILANLSIARQQDILTVLNKTGRLREQSDEDITHIIHRLKAIRKQGYSVHSRQRTKSYVGYMRISDLTSISVPIAGQTKEAIGAITIRYATDALTREKALDDFMPLLAKTAADISKKVTSNNIFEESLVASN
jgi:IclR family mhp operon transcriptional activator|tara:strand:- start:284 stop:1099 length:816 start_codon:yes stop_codon:yes gene_type:complete